MTSEQMKDFLKQVMGKKIRKSGWRKDSYFIPSGMAPISQCNSHGWMVGKSHDGVDMTLNISNGFDVDSTGHRWEFTGDSIPVFEVGDMVKLNKAGHREVSHYYQVDSSNFTVGEIIGKLNDSWTVRFKTHNIILSPSMMEKVKADHFPDIDIDDKPQQCQHLNRYKNIISANLKFWCCSDCGADLGDIKED